MGDMDLRSWTIGTLVLTGILSLMLVLTMIL